MINVLNRKLGALNIIVRCGLITLVAICTSALFSCNSKKKHVEHVEQNATQSFSILGKEYYPLDSLRKINTHKNDHLTIQEYENNSGIKYKIGFTKVRFDEKQIKSLYKDLFMKFSNINSSLNPISIVIYSNCKYDKINSSNIKGLSIITKLGNKLEHTFYEIKNGEVSENRNLNTAFNAYDVNDFMVLLTQKLTIDSSFASYLFITTSEFNAFRAIGQQPIYLTRKLIETGILARPKPGNNQCESCYDDSETESCVFDENGDTHCSGGCENKILVDVGNKLKKAVDIDLKKAYSFRDSILKKSEKGRKYITYYYQISYVIGGLSLINANTFVETLAFTKTIYSIADRLQYGSENEIIITIELKNKLISTIDYYSSKTTNKEFQLILSEIKEDINRYTNKTRSYILNDIKVEIKN